MVQDKGGMDEQMRDVSAKEGASDILEKNNIKQMRAREFRSIVLFCTLDSESRTVKKATNLDETFELSRDQVGHVSALDKYIIWLR